MDIQCVQIKCIKRLVAKNLDDFNIEFGQPVYYSVNPSSNVSTDPSGSEEPPHFNVVPHSRYISDISQSHQRK